MPVKLRETKRLGSRHHEKRRGRRMNSRVPVRLEWNDASGKRVSVEAHTRVVNPYGCMVVLAQPLELEHRLALINKISKTSNAAIVFWRATSGPTAGNTASSSWRPKWNFGAWTCEAGVQREALALREARLNQRGAFRRDDDAATHRRGTAPRAAGSAEDAHRRAPCWETEARRWVYAYGQRYGGDDHSSRRPCARHEVHPRKSEDATEGRSKCGPSAADESGRIAASRRVPFPRAAILEYHFPA